MVADAFESHSPGAVLLQDQTVLAAGSPESIGQPSEASLVHCPGELVCPAFVNAHCHLDLSDLSTIQERSFGPWLTEVIRHRMRQEAPGAVEKAVSLGLERSIAGGTFAVGDICGSKRAFAALCQSKLQGVAFLEFLGHGSRSEPAIEAIHAWVAEIARTGMPDGSELQPGLSPHAPYSTSESLYDAAKHTGLPISTHLAESLEELEWCRARSGFFAELNDRMGVEPHAGPACGQHSVEGYVDLLPLHGALAVHLNYIESHHLERLKRSGVTVVYCPRASAFFGHPHEGRPDHAWRSMRAAGIPVALGTDGRPCLPSEGVAGDRLSVLDDVLHLQRTCGITLDEWLPMATLDGARALGLPDELVSLKSGATPGILALKLSPGKVGQLDADSAIRWLSDPPPGITDA